MGILKQKQQKEAKAFFTPGAIITMQAHGPRLSKGCIGTQYVRHAGSEELDVRKFL